MKRVIITVTNDLEIDQRMHKTALNLHENGFEVLLLGRKLPYSKPLNREYATHRMKLLFKHGVLFYACYNFRLLMYLLFHSWDIVLSCDMDSLPGAYTAKRLRRKKLVFDSHELFSEVPEIQNKSFVKKVWVKLESKLLPKLKHAYTVCQSIADYYHEKYGVTMDVIRNVPMKSVHSVGDSEPGTEKYLMYQGALNEGRGLEKLIQAMNDLPGLQLKIAGDGPLRSELGKFVQESSAADRIEFLGRLNFSDLRKVTRNALLGFSIEEDRGLNYRFALPNKLFDYMHAGVPSIVSNLPEMAAVIKESGAGYLIESDCSANELAEKIVEVLADQQQFEETKKAALKAAEVYNWESESKRQLEIFRSVAEFSKVNA